MANTSEDDPVRLKDVRPHKRLALPFLYAVALPNRLPITCPFDLALDRRRSADLFGPISPAELGTLLKFTAGLQATNLTDSNRQRRFVGSFGALHPAHILIGTRTHRWGVYLPDSHALGVLEVDKYASNLLWEEAQTCHAGRGAILLALLADLDLAESYYMNPRQLLLRDGGVLFGHASLVAAAIDLSFRILGTVGGPNLGALICGLGFRSMGTGLAWVGGSTTEPMDDSISSVDQIDSLLGAG